MTTKLELRETLAGIHDAANDYILQGTDAAPALANAMADAMYIMEKVDAEEAAAPDLLEACKAMVAYDEERNLNMGSPWRDVLLRARAAIARAEGRE